MTPTELEARLRDELPELAHALTTTALPPTGSSEPPDQSDPHGGPKPVRWVGPMVLAAVLAVLLGLAVWAIGRDDATVGPAEPDTIAGDPEPDAPTGDPVAVPAEPDGSWRVLPDAPLETRSDAIAGWVDGEVVFWAGSGATRTLAFTDGAAFDPRSDTWRTLDVPGWGHPGLTGTALDDRLYVVAKGEVVAFDPTRGESVDLPLASMAAAGVVAGEDRIWAVGTDEDSTDELRVASYSPGTGGWDTGSPWSGGGTTARLIDGLVKLDHQLLWTGSEVVAWDSRGGGAAYDPTTDSWRTIPAPVLVPDGAVLESAAVVTDAGLTAVTVVEDDNGSSLGSVWRLTAEDWVPVAADLPLAELASATMVAAGGWVVILPAEGRTVTIDATTGAWTTHDGPLAGSLGPSAVWTGSELVVWGGTAPIPGTTDPARVDGAVWTPTILGGG